MCEHVNTILTSHLKPEEPNTEIPPNITLCLKSQSLDLLVVSVWVSTTCSGFFYVMWTRDAKLPLGVNVFVFVSVL